MLWRALGSVEKGRYIDLGAQDPIVDSVSLLFYENGWRGMHVEPTTHYANLLRFARPDEVVIQAAVTANNGIISLYEFPETGLSTCDRTIAEKHRDKGFVFPESVVPGFTLDDVFSRQSDTDVHWLKIDVEGGERQVLEGWRHSKLRPWIILIESTLPISQVENFKRWEALVVAKGKGYTFAHFDGLNRFYIADEHAQLFKAFTCGPNVFDAFALRGTATSLPCRNLNTQLSELQSQLAQERENLTGRLSSQTADRSAQLKELTRVGAREKKELKNPLRESLVESFELSRRLAAAQQQALDDAAHLASERDLISQLLSIQTATAADAKAQADKFIELVDDSPAREQLFAGQLAERDGLLRQLAQKVREIASAQGKLSPGDFQQRLLSDEIQKAQTTIAQVQKARAETESQLQARLNELNASLATTYETYSRRLTAPFRALAGYFPRHEGHPTCVVFHRTVDQRSRKL